MKTNRRIQTWLRCAAALLLVVTGSLSTQAQEIEGGEAFYIYQNDGHFDGFFYDQVKQINYSRYDTLGVEYDQYVSQEIVTEDSVYRIMLSAIDSVSFVQPEIKYAEGVRFMRDEGLLAYYQSISKPSDDSFLLRFSSSMPASLQPKVGDVLLCPNLKDYDEAFVGKVKKVRTEGGNLLVECGYVEDFSEVFEQFITVEQIKEVQAEEGSKTRRRLAGYPGAKRAEGNWEDFTLFELSTHLEGNINLGSDKSKFIFGVDIGFATVANAAYKIKGWRDFYIKMEVKPQIGLNFSASIDGQLNGELNMKSIPGVGELLDKFSKIPFPASCPILYINVLPQPFVRGEAHLNFGLNTGPKVKALGIGLEMMSKPPYVVPSLGLLASTVIPVAQFMPSQVGGEFKISAEVNGMAQLGIKFPIELGTMDWLKLIAKTKATTTLFTGPKLEGKFPLGSLSAHSIYDNLKDAELTLRAMSLDMEFATKAEFWGWEGEVKKSINASMGVYPMKAFPSIDINDMKIDIYGEKKNNVRVSYNTSGNVFFPQLLGVGIYKKADENDKEYRQLYMKKSRYETYFLNTFNSVEVTFEGLEGGEYVVCPIVQPTFPIIPTDNDGLIPVDKGKVKMSIALQDMLISPTEIQAEEEGGEFIIDIQTGFDTPITCEPFDKWIKAEVVTENKDSRKLKVTVDENQTDKFRTSVVYVRQQASKDETIERELTVKQYGGLELSKYKLEFEAGGGEETIDILTSYKPININLNNGLEWLTYRLDDRKLTIIAKPDQGGNRTATVFIAGWSKKKNQYVEVKLTVTQKGIVDAVVEPSKLTFAFNGGTQRVGVTMGKDVTFTGLKLSEGASSWILVEKQNDHFNVTAIPNTGMTERECTITATFTAKDASGKTFTADIPVAVTQGASTASVTPQLLTFSADGGTQTVTVDYGGWTYFDAIVADEHASWLSAKAAANGTVTVTVKKNTSGGRREGTVFCYVTNEQNPTDEQILYLPVTVKQASDVPEPAYLKVDGAPTLGYRAQIYRLKLDTNLPKVTVESDVSWASATVVGDEIILSVERNRTFENRNGYLMVYGYDDNNKMQKAAALALTQGYNGILKSLMETSNVVVGFKGAINGYWTDGDGGMHYVDYGSGLANVPTYKNRWKTTCTEAGEYGAHIVAIYDYEDERLSVDITYDDVDEGTITKLVYTYDYASGDKYRHTRLEAVNIPRNGGNSGDGTSITTLSERTARMWGLVSGTAGPYGTNFTTNVNGLAGNDFSLTVLIQK